MSDVILICALIALAILERGFPRWFWRSVVRGR